LLEAGTTNKEKTSPNGEIPLFNQITDTPLTRATLDQLRILHTRYNWAVHNAAGKDVLEAACGAGVGLGSIARSARHVVGGDIDAFNCALASQTYKDRRNIDVLQLDVTQTSLPAASFDLILLFEAIYYLNSAEAFIAEAKRLLKPGGSILISSVNWRWKGFNRSPFSTKYYDAEELRSLLESSGFSVSTYGGFPEMKSAIGGISRALRKLAIRFRLIPNTQRSKQWLKRIFYGHLEPIPRELVIDPAMCDELKALKISELTDPYRFIFWDARLP
jgi:2-polyprenyl-3-methyl-5-hydroxy-6-metoxy-1,4-benzoquinol methylase